MSEQALQALKYLAQNGPCRIGTPLEVTSILASKGLIVQCDPLNKTWALTPYGKGILRIINNAGTNAMLKMLESYL